MKEKLTCGAALYIIKVGGGKPNLLYEWPGVIEEEDTHMSLIRMSGMAKRLVLIRHNQFALPLLFVEMQESSKQKEGADNV